MKENQNKVDCASKKEKNSSHCFGVSASTFKKELDQ